MCVPLSVVGRKQEPNTQEIAWVWSRTLQSNSKHNMGKDCHVYRIVLDPDIAEAMDKLALQ